jgi:hypothetical protein
MLSNTAFQYLHIIHEIVKLSNYSIFVSIRKINYNSYSICLLVVRYIIYKGSPKYILSVH